MSSSIIVEILLAVLAAMVGLGSFVGANRAGRLQATGTLADIDAKAYERARVIYESAIDTLNDHVVNLRAQMKSLDEEITRLQATNRSLIQQVSELQSTNRALIVQVSELQAGNARLLVELKKRDEKNE